MILLRKSVAREVVYHAVIQKAVFRKRVLDLASWCLLLLLFVSGEDDDDEEEEYGSNSGLVSGEEEDVSIILSR